MTGNLSIWLTPVWILAAGVTLGALVLMLLYAILWLVSKPAAATTLRVVRESVLLWISYLVLVYLVFFVVALPMVWGVRIGERNLPQLVVASLGRMPYVGSKSATFEIPRRTDEVSWSGHRFEVMDVDGYKIDQVMVTRSRALAPPDTPA